MADINYAVEYSNALAQAFPYTLNFGALYSTPNNNRYRWVNARTIQIPRISTSGRVAADRDTIGVAQRNYDNAWETKTLDHPRKWSTLIHPADIAQTNGVAAIANITRVFNEEQKFPEMDAYCVSKIYNDWLTTTAEGADTTRTADTTALTTANVLSVFDSLMLKMDNERVPANGRILYCTHEVKALLKNADQISRTLDVNGNNGNINRMTNRLEEVKIIGVPATLMKTKYKFTIGYEMVEDADQINMFLVHPSSIITPVAYSFVTLDTERMAIHEGKYYYYEESDEDVFILNAKSGGVQFNITAHA